MGKKYFFALLIVFMFLGTQQGFSQTVNNKPSTQQKIDGLSIYPNPVGNGNRYIYISSKKNLNKKIEVFNALGRRISSRILVGKQLDISELNTGIYILKINENNVSETRKLVIK